MKLAASRGGLSQESRRRLLLTSLTIRRQQLKGVLQEYGPRECGAVQSVLPRSNNIVRRRYYYHDNNEMA
jgi:hypothetical protein